MALNNSSSNGLLDHLPLVSLERIYLLYYARENNIVFLTCYQDVVDALDIGSMEEDWKQQFENSSENNACNNTMTESTSIPPSSSSDVSIYIRNSGLLCDKTCRESLYELVRVRQQLCSQRIVKLVIEETKPSAPQNQYSIPAQNLAHLFRMSSHHIEILTLDSLRVMTAGNFQETSLSESLTDGFPKLHTMECYQCTLEKHRASSTSNDTSSRDHDELHEEPLMVSLSKAISSLPNLEIVKMDVSRDTNNDERSQDDHYTEALLEMAVSLANTRTLKNLSLNGIIRPETETSDFGRLCRAIQSSHSIDSVALWDPLSRDKLQTFSTLAIRDNVLLKDVFLVLEPTIDVSLDPLVEALHSKNEMERIHIVVPFSDTGDNDEHYYHDQPIVSTTVLNHLVEELLHKNNYALQEFTVNHERLSTTYLEQQQPRQRYGAMASHSQNTPKQDTWLCERLDFYLNLNQLVSPTRKRLLMDDTFTTKELMDALADLFFNDHKKNEGRCYDTTTIPSSSSSSTSTKVSMVYSLLSAKPGFWVS